MSLIKKLSIILLGLFLLTVTGCQSNTASTSHKNSSGETQQMKAKSSSSSVDRQNDDTGNTDSSSVDNNNGDSQSANSGQSSDDKSNSDQNKSSSTSDAKASSSNQSQSNTPSTQKQIINERITTVRVADSKTGWIGGEGWIAKTNDGGKNWQVQYQGSKTVHQVFALNHQKVWAAFDNNSLLGSSDGGQHWSSIGKVPNQGFLHYISNDVGFSANAETLDGGKTWRNLPTPKGLMGDAYFHDSKNGWAVTKGKDLFQVEKTTDGGHTWQTVMTKKISDASLTGVVIRSAGFLDAWIECIGDSGMTQTSYSLFHTVDGGKNWQVVIANSTAGGGPAPGFTMNDKVGHQNQGSSPGMLYVVNSNTAFMNGQCEACDNPNTIGWTNDGGKTWINGKAKLTGYGPNLLAFADATHGWWITTENTKPSVLFTTSDGGQHWTKLHIFK